MTTIQNKTFDEERALYAARDILVQECAFDGPADGESAFKEGRDIAVNGCSLTSAIRSGTTRD